jgi:nickel/cobalt transporter (NicO) family protein
VITLIAGSLVLSVLHALIPNHWLPILAISRQEKWSLGRTTYITFLSGLSHALSTVFIGMVIGLLGVTISEQVTSFTHLIAPVILIAIGLFYIYQHHRHKHFHLHQQPSLPKNRIIMGLVIAMFFSPCLEIEAYFLMAGVQGWEQVVFLSLLYTTVTISGMVLWVRFTYRGLFRWNWHALEHNAGIITGLTLVLTGVASFFIH